MDMQIALLLSVKRARALRCAKCATHFRCGSPRWRRCCFVMLCYVVLCVVCTRNVWGVFVAGCVFTPGFLVAVAVEHDNEGVVCKNTHTHTKKEETKENVYDFASTFFFFFFGGKLNIVPNMYYRLKNYTMYYFYLYIVIRAKQHRNMQSDMLLCCVTYARILRARLHVIMVQICAAVGCDDERVVA